MRYEFGPFLLDTGALLLFRGEDRTSLTPKAIETLRILVENSGRVVDRRELLFCVWGDVNVEEANLTQTIFALRKTLGETPRDHRFIATIPGKGYRFVAEVKRVVSPLSNERSMPNVSRETKLSRRISSRQSHIVFLTLTILLAIGLVFWHFGRKHESPENYLAVPLTSYIGSALCPSFAPEGERVAFTWNGEKQDNFDIYVKQVGLGLPLRLTTDARPDVSPAWSPDGRTVAFLRLFDDKAALLLISSATNGSERQIAELTVPHRMFMLQRFLCWSPNGKWIIVSDGSKTSVGAGVALSLISIETGEKRRLSHPAFWNDDLSPAMSSDMKHLVFARYTGAVSDLYVLDLSKELQPLGEPKRLTFYQQATSSPVWMPNGKSLLFTRFSSLGSPSLWRMSLDAPGGPVPVPVAADNASWLDVSPKGDSLVFTRETQNENIWAIQSGGPSLWASRTNTSKPWITSSRQEGTPQFSPNGRQIAFQSTRSGWSEIWISDRDGSHPRQLTNFKAAVAGFPHWSPDSTKVVFHLRDHSQASIVVQDVQSGSSKRLTTGAGNDGTPSWSHDGKWIYFTSERNGGDQIWRMPAEGGPAKQLTAHGGWAPEESGDGRYLFYTKSKLNGVWRMPLSGTEDEQVVSNVAGAGASYAVGRRGIYFIDSANGERQQHLAFLNFDTRQVTSLTGIPYPVGMGLTISPDEQILLYSQMDHVNSDLMLVEHFH